MGKLRYGVIKKLPSLTQWQVEMGLRPRQVALEAGLFHAMLPSPPGSPGMWASLGDQQTYMCVPSDGGISHCSWVLFAHLVVKCGTQSGWGPTQVLICPDSCCSDKQQAGPEAQGVKSYSKNMFSALEL